MAFNFFGFGKKKRRTTRRRVTRRRKTVGVKKTPSKTLLRLCKKYGVKVQSKRGRTRRYKSARVLKKQCAKKIKSLIRRASKFGATRRSGFGARGGRRVTRRRMMVAPMMAAAPVRRSFRSRASSALRGGGRHLGKNYGKYAALVAAGFAAKRYGGAEYKHRRGRELFMADVGRARGMFRRKKTPTAASAFGRRRRVGRPRKVRRRRVTRRRRIAGYGKRRVGRPRKVRRSRRVTRRRRTGVRRSRFGYQPTLSSMMGNEFCSGGGGVLGANSTGLFPSPCTGGSVASMGSMPPTNQNVMAAYKAASGMYGPVSAPAAAFGKRRRVSRRRY